MSQNSGPFLVSSHGHPSFNPRLPSSSSLPPSLKRPTNGPMSIGNVSNTSVGSNMNISSSPSSMRPSSSMGPMKPGTVGMNPMDKSNSMPYSSRFPRKAWPMTRSIHDRNIRGHDDHESAYLRSGLPPNHGAPSDGSGGSSFTIEPSTDDDEGDDIHFSARHMTAARFQRNQRLLSEIFNEVCIPDLRSNVSVERISTLRRQVDALKTHRDTFEKDLNDLEEKHIEKKRKFTEANEKFYSEYAEASSKNLSQEKIDEILQKYETMEKLQKEKQLLLQQQQQQQQAVATPTPPPPPPSSTTTTTTIPTALSESTAPAVVKNEPTSIVESSQQESSSTIPSPPPAAAAVQTQLPLTQSVSAPLPPTQLASSQIPPSQPTSNQLPPSQPIPNQLPTSHPIQSQMPSSQPVPTQLPPSQPIPSQLPPSQPVQPQLPPPLPQAPPVMQQVPPHQQPPPPTSQGYPMMHSGGGYAPVPGYGHPQQTQYRPPMNQRPAQYPSNVQWQQQPPQQQQWQGNTYDPRYYNTYPSNVQWQQQQPQQQWPPNQPQQQMSVGPHPQQTHMRGHPQQQQQPPPQQMYGNGVHYGYGGTPAGWNPGAHPSQQYGYAPNPSYDPSLVSTAPQQQQQYYSPQQMHNPPQGYDYGPPQPQQQIPPQQ